MGGADDGGDPLGRLREAHTTGPTPQERGITGVEGQIDRIQMQSIGSQRGEELVSKAGRKAGRSAGVVHRPSLSQSGTLRVTCAAVPIPDDLHEWLAFDDGDGDAWLIDATFLASRWTCIYGSGCRGIEADSRVDEHGCCIHGAHFADKADRQRVRAAVKRLTPDQWQLAGVAADLGKPITKNADGDWVTRTHDGGCIFLNRPDFARGAGCALHVAALDHGERPLDWKPDVCWQLPVRLDSHVDDNKHTTWILREWRTRDWGEGGHEFSWWCTESPEAHVGEEPVWRALRDELIEMCGQDAYGRMDAALTERGEGTLLPHPTVRRRTGRS